MRGTVLLIAGVLCVSRAPAQDPFEIHVYEYEPLSWHEYSLEAHVNGMAQGTDMRDGSLVPANQQKHLTLEPTLGISENLALGFMFLSAWEPGYGPQFAGWRVLPHFYAPESWGLPFRLGFVAEFSFQNTRYEENSRRAEFRPILDKEFSHWQIVFNPVVERALHGPGTRRGWNLEPAMLLRLKRPKFSPSVEYYGEVESLNVRPRAQPEVHQLFLGGDWQAAEIFSVNFGIVVKSRFEWDWRKPGKKP